MAVAAAAEVAVAESSLATNSSIKLVHLDIKNPCYLGKMCTKVIICV